MIGHSDQAQLLEGWLSRPHCFGEGDPLYLQRTKKTNESKQTAEDIIDKKKHRFP